MIVGKYLIVNIGVFLVAFFCLLLAPFSIVLNFLALFLFGVGFGMIAFTLTKNYNKLKSNIKNKQDELMLEIATEKGGEKYVLNNSPFSSKQTREIKALFRDKFVSLIVTWFISLVMLYFSVRILF